MLVLAKVLGDLMHLGRLIHRTTDKEYPFSHCAHPEVAWEPRRIPNARAHGGNSPGADDTILSSRNSRIRLPPVYPIAAKTGRKPAIVQFSKFPSDRGQFSPIPDFHETLGVQISYALNAIVIHATGNGPAVEEHRQG